uniref:Uncharacterized protein n=1 Tax=Glossina palpalis gambiensis TaxID=67801 RepID=A0A1B0C746_9MUSC
MPMPQLLECIYQGKAHLICKSPTLQATHHNSLCYISVHQRFIHQSIHARYKLRFRTSVEHDKLSAIQERCSNDAHMLGNYMPPMSSNTVMSSSLCSLYGKCPLSCHKDTPILYAFDYFGRMTFGGNRILLYIFDEIIPDSEMVFKSVELRWIG